MEISRILIACMSAVDRRISFRPPCCGSLDQSRRKLWRDWMSQASSYPQTSGPLARTRATGPAKSRSGRSGNVVAIQGYNDRYQPVSCVRRIQKGVGVSLSDAKVLLDAAVLDGRRVELVPVLTENALRLARDLRALGLNADVGAPARLGKAGVLVEVRGKGVTRAVRGSVRAAGLRKVSRRRDI